MQGSAGSERVDGMRRRLRSSRRLLVLLLAAFVATACLMHLQGELARQSRLRIESTAAADRFVELAVRARLLARIDPAAISNSALIGDGLFDAHAMRTTWESAVEIRWALLAGDPVVVVVELDGLPQQPCPWFAARVLQRAHDTRARGVRINGVVFATGDAAAPHPVEGPLPCGQSNAIALMIAVPALQALPQAPKSLEV